MTEPERLSPDELRTLFLFEALSDEQLAWLAERGRVVRVRGGRRHPRRRRARVLHVRPAVRDARDVEPGAGR